MNDENSLVELREDGEGTLSRALQDTQLASSQVLRRELDILSERVRKSKLKLKDKVALMNSLVRSHESLTKTERMAAGLDSRHSSVVNAGVIIVPHKTGSESWHELALEEVERAQSEDGSPAGSLSAEG
jgi:hypothetical protein